jgi:hypothetical protein
LPGNKNYLYLLSGARYPSHEASTHNIIADKDKLFKATAESVLPGNKPRHGDTAKAIAWLPSKYCVLNMPDALTPGLACFLIKGSKEVLAWLLNHPGTAYIWPIFHAAFVIQ